MGQKASNPLITDPLNEDFSGLILVDRGVQTSQKASFSSEDQPSFFSRTMTRFLKQKPLKSIKMKDFGTQIDPLDLKLRSKHLTSKRSLICGCGRKNHNKWLILQNEEYFMEYEPLEDLLKKSRKSPELMNLIEKESSKEFKLKTFIEKEREIPGFIKENGLSFCELQGFLNEKPQEINIKEIEIIETLFEGDFQHIYKAFYQRKFVLMKIVEFDRLEPRKIDFEEALLRDLLKEGYLYESLKTIEDEGLCQLIAMFSIRRKSPIPENPRILTFIQIAEYGRCSLKEILIQRELKESLSNIFSNNFSNKRSLIFY